MQIWVDGDACPQAVREIIFKAAVRTNRSVTLVANRFLRPPALKNVSAIQVAMGPDEADNEIIRRLSAGDLVITGDIPLAARVIELGGHALNPRGRMYSTDDVRECLSLRDYAADLLAGGVAVGGPPPLQGKDLQKFANSLDRFLTRSLS